MTHHAKPRLVDELRRVTIVCAFVLGSGTFAAVAVPLSAAIAIDYVPVVPVCVATATAVALAGGVAGLAAARRWFSIVPAACAGLVAGILAAAAGQAIVWLPAAGSLAWGLRPLDDARWRDATTGETGFNERGKMVFALVATRPLHGTPRTQVLATLGPPDCASTPNEDAWHIGRWTGFQLDQDCLHVRYTEARASGIEVRPAVRAPAVRPRVLMTTASPPARPPRRTKPAQSRRKTSKRRRR